MLTILCDTCQSKLQCQQRLLGHRVRCPSCGASLTISQNCGDPDESSDDSGTYKLAPSSPPTNGPLSRKRRRSDRQKGKESVEKQSQNLPPPLSPKEARRVLIPFLVIISVFMLVIGWIVFSIVSGLQETHKIMFSSLPKPTVMTQDGVELPDRTIPYADVASIELRDTFSTHSRRTKRNWVTSVRGKLELVVKKKSGEEITHIIWPEYFAHEQEWWSRPPDVPGSIKWNIRAMSNVFRRAPWVRYSVSHIDTTVDSDANWSSHGVWVSSIREDRPLIWTGAPDGKPVARVLAPDPLPGRPPAVDQYVELPLDVPEDQLYELIWGKVLRK